jgi:hypothetical protein
VVSQTIKALFLTRHGDWVMRMRFWGANTRERGASGHQRLQTHALRPKARSHAPITAPKRLWGAASNQLGDALCEGQGGDREAGGYT